MVLNVPFLSAEFAYLYYIDKGSVDVIFLGVEMNFNAPKVCLI